MAANLEVQEEDNTTQQFEALFNYATIGIIVTDQSGKIINFNRCAESQFRYSKEELLGRYIEVLIPDRFHASHVRQRDNFYQHPEPRSMGAGRDLFAKRKDNSVFPVEVSLSHYVYMRQTYVIAFVIDITVRKNSELVVVSQKEELQKITSQVMELNVALEQKVEDRTKMLRETLAELEMSKIELSEALQSEKELSDLKSNFVTLASHEFRTPLSTILSSAYLLEQYVGNEGNTGKHIKRIRSAVLAMKNILEDFLSLGKLEEGLIEMKQETMPGDGFCTFLQSVTEEMDLLLKPGQQIAVQCSVQHPVTADMNLLKNILINLLSNAIKFSPGGGAIALLCGLTGNHLEITVEDHGIGISPEDQQHLFGRFFRAKNAANIQGTGLGLHIVGKYLELMHGTIAMRSVLHEGTTFTVRIPANEKQLHEKDTGH